MWIIKKQIPQFKAKVFILESFPKALVLCIFSAFIGWVVHSTLQQSIWRIIVVSITTVSFISTTGYYLILNLQQRKLVINSIKQKLHPNNISSN